MLHSRDSLTEPGDGRRSFDEKQPRADEGTPLFDAQALDASSLDASTNMGPPHRGRRGARLP